MSSWQPTNDAQEFEGRKRDHIRLALEARNEALGSSGFDRVDLEHEALPDLDFSEIHIQTEVFGRVLKAPFLVSSMTAGHAEGVDLNRRLAEACSDQGWMMGVGSQRRELFDSEAGLEWRRVRQSAPKTVMLGNIGLSQVIQAPIESAQRLVDSLEATALIVHLNPLQECLQPEGTPQFRGGLAALERLCRSLSVPVVVKETGCGISIRTLKRINETGVAAVDVSGYGGTHWGRIEGDRGRAGDLQMLAAQTFHQWGIPTAEILARADSEKFNFQIWASGGIRSGLDSAKALAMGARIVGFAKPVLVAALAGEASLRELMARYEFELRVAMFCSGNQDIGSFAQRRVWHWRKT